MPAPNLTSRFKRAAHAQATEECPLVLLTVTHADLPGGVLRLVDNTEAVTSRGNVYEAIRFRARVHREDGETLAGAELEIDNIDPTLLQNMRATEVPFDCAIEVVLASEPDHVQRGPWLLSLTDLSYDALSLHCELGVEPVLDEPSPGDTYNPEIAPGLYA